MINHQIKQFSLALIILVFVLGIFSSTLATNRLYISGVPFTSQAPLAEWRDQRQQDGCEEATAAMAMAWVGGEQNITKANWRLRILILSDFEYRKYHEYRDISLEDMVAWLFNDYFRYQKVEIKNIETKNDIIKELEQGNMILTPMDGRLLKNPFYSPPGPERHMILIRGYDYQTKEFITNDPGTRRGENYRYSENTLFKAIRAYSTGYHNPIDEIEKKMIVISR